jgi:hypothetical protein
MWDLSIRLCRRPALGMIPSIECSRDPTAGGRFPLRPAVAPRYFSRVGRTVLTDAIPGWLTVPDTLIMRTGGLIAWPYCLALCLAIYPR